MGIGKNFPFWKTRLLFFLLYFRDFDSSPPTTFYGAEGYCECSLLNHRGFYCVAMAGQGVSRRTDGC